MSAHGISPYRTALELVTAGPKRAPVFGVTEERGPGGIVVPLLRVEIPVCEEYPNSEKAFGAVLAYHAEFNLYRDALQDAVSPRSAFEAGVEAQADLSLAERARGRRKAPVAS